MRLSLVTTALSLLLVGALHAADAPVAQTKPYPLKTCLITGATLGGMGDPIVKIYDGQEIKFCCGACPKSFEKDPAKYIAEMNKQAAALSAAPGTAAPAAAAPKSAMGCCK